MKIAIIVVIAVVLVGAGIELISRLIAKKESDQLKGAAPEDRFRYQADARKRQM